MRLEWLEYFSDAALLGSIKASADKHNISPQGLSKCIRSLETELGVKLFERDANSVQLTSAGSHLLGQIRKTIDASQELIKQAHSISSGDTRAPLAIMCSAFVFLCAMMEPLREGVRLIRRAAAYSQMHTNDMLAMLAGRIDPLFTGRTLCGIPILFSPLRDQNEKAILSASLNGYDYAPLFTYHDGVLVSSEHPLADAGTISRDALLNYPVVSSSTEQLAPLVKFLGPGHISSAIADLATRLQVIQDNESVIFMPPFSDVVNDPQYRLINVEDAYEAEIGIVYDRAELGAQDIELLISPIIASYLPFEEAGLCSIVYGRQAKA